MCCASAGKMNEIGEKVICKYGNIEIGMPIFMDGIASIKDAGTIRKGIRNCRKMEKGKKIQYGLKNTKYMTIIAGREKQEQIEVKEGKTEEVDKYIYLEIMLNKGSNVKEQLKKSIKSKQKNKITEWNIIKTHCSARRDQGENETL